MRLQQQKDGTLHLVTNAPLLTYDLLNSTRTACELDEGRLFVITRKDSRTGAVETDFRLKAVEDDTDLARKRELEHLETPSHFLRHAPEEIDEIYLGRYYVASVSALISFGGNTLIEARTELVPVIIPRFDWGTSDDGQEMLDLATNAGVDQRKLYVVAAACAQMTIHLTRNMPQPRLALEAVEAWAKSDAGDDEMERAISENSPGRDEMLCDLCQRDGAFRYAADAALCDPSNVVANVANAAAADMRDMAQDMDYPTAKKYQRRVQNLMRAAYANIIRKSINIAEYPGLTMAIEQRNSALCHAPSCNFGQWDTGAANQLLAN